MDAIRESVSSIWSLQLWNHIHKRRLDLELSRNPRLKITWEMMKTKRILESAVHQLDRVGCESLQKRVYEFLQWYDTELREDPVGAIESAYNLICEIHTSVDTKSILQESLVDSSSTFFPLLFRHYLSLLHSPENPYAVECCKEVIMMVSELLSQLSTRRYFAVFVKDSHFVAYTRTSPLFKDKSIQSLLKRLTYYLHFEMDPITGSVYSREEFDRFYYKKMVLFQKILFK